MTEKLRDLLKLASMGAERVFAAKGELLPMWHAETADGVSMLVPAPPTDNKDLAVRLIKALFEERHVVRFVFFDEAWTLRSTDRAVVDKAVDHGDLSTHPDRVEVVVFVAEDAEGGALGGRRLIHRAPGKKATLGPLEIHEYLEAEGRLIGLLPQRGTLQ
jgi:Exo-beta-1,3-glucanase